jgi:hypothetical protein
MTYWSKATTIVLVNLFWVLFPSLGRADSPLTSTDFAEAYLDVPIVGKARATGRVDAEIASFLSSEAPIDVKAAVVNALGWDIKGKNNGAIYRTFLARSYNTTPQNLDLNFLTVDELMSLGYMTALDDYFNVIPALAILQRARRIERRSYTIAMIESLTRAQAARNFCQTWQAIQPLEFPTQLNIDMRRTARAIIWEYMKSYEKYCGR